MAKAKDDPVPPEFIEKMRMICEMIDLVFNGPPGQKPLVAFAVLTARFDDIAGGRVNYMANCDRASMLAAMREYIARADADAAGRVH